MQSTMKGKEKLAASPPPGTTALTEPLEEERTPNEPKNVHDIIVENRILLLLLRAAYPLSRPATLKNAEIANAAVNAQNAALLAESVPGMEVLWCRCTYYVGLASVLQAVVQLQPNAWEDHKQPPPGWQEMQSRSLQLFQSAAKAKGYCGEGSLAEEWIEYLQDIGTDSSLDENGRPTSSSSWSGRLYDHICGPNRAIGPAWSDASGRPWSRSVISATPEPITMSPVEQRSLSQASQRTRPASAQLASPTSAVSPRRIAIHPDSAIKYDDKESSSPRELPDNLSPT